MTIIGVSHVGFLTEGPWKGCAVIGRSLAVGPSGEVLALGPYGRDAEALVIVDVEPKPRDYRGTDIAAHLVKRGYTGH